MDIKSDDKIAKFLYDFSDFINTLDYRASTIKDLDKLVQKVQSLTEFLKQNSLAVTIALHAYEGLAHFLEFIAHQLLDTSTYVGTNEESKKKLKIKLANILNVIYNSSYECFLRREGYGKDKRYEQIIRKCMKVITVENEVQSSLCHLLYTLTKIQAISQSQEKRKNLNSFITHHLMVQKTRSPFEEIALNWIKKKVEAIQNENIQNVCCHILFEHKATNHLGKFSETLNQQFKDYRWPLENESIKAHFTRTIVGFLNTTGGIIYVGLKEDKKKMIEVKGIRLNPQQKLDFLYFLHDDILKGVYPKQADRKKYEQDPANNQDYLKRLKDQLQSVNKFEYRLNKYVHVDFIDIYNKDNLINSREDGCSLYIVRIKIKIGDCRELYHVINQDKQIPEAYFREQKSVKKKSLPQFYALFYERMKNTEAIVGNAKMEQHPNCRFSIRCTQA